MSGKLRVWLVVLMCAVGAAFLIFGLACAPHVPQPVAASGDSALISWSTISTILTALGYGSFIAPITALLSKAQWFFDLFHKVVPNTDPTNTTVSPAPSPDIKTDTVELIAAVVAYVEHKDDKFSQDRFFTAIQRELYDVLATEYPELAASLNALIVARANALFPATKGTAQ